MEKSRGTNYDPSAVQPVASRYTDCAIPDCESDISRRNLQNVREKRYPPTFLTGVDTTAFAKYNGGNA
jgi:hypothetical protein